VYEDVVKYVNAYTTPTVSTADGSVGGYPKSVNLRGWNTWVWALVLA
jgi:hypothetical protein